MKSQSYPGPIQRTIHADPTVQRRPGGLLSRKRQWQLLKLVPSFKKVLSTVKEDRESLLSHLHSQVCPHSLGCRLWVPFRFHGHFRTRVLDPVLDYRMLSLLSHAGHNLAGAPRIGICLGNNTQDKA
jgi:hypothetical protein